MLRRVSAAAVAAAALLTACGSSPRTAPSSTATARATATTATPSATPSPSGDAVLFVDPLTSNTNDWPLADTTDVLQEFSDGAYRVDGLTGGNTWVIDAYKSLSTLNVVVDVDVTRDADSGGSAADVWGLYCGATTNDGNNWGRYFLTVDGSGRAEVTYWRSSDTTFTTLTGPGEAVAGVSTPGNPAKNHLRMECTKGQLGITLTLWVNGTIATQNVAPDTYAGADFEGSNVGIAVYSAHGNTDTRWSNIVVATPAQPAPIIKPGAASPSASPAG